METAKVVLAKQTSTEKGSDFFNFFGELFVFAKKTINGDENQVRSDDYWSYVVKEASDIAYRHGENGDLAKDMLIAYLGVLEKRDKEEKERES